MCTDPDHSGYSLWYVSTRFVRVGFKSGRSSTCSSAGSPTHQYDTAWRDSDTGFNPSSLNLFPQNRCAEINTSYIKRESTLRKHRFPFRTRTKTDRALISTGVRWIVGERIEVFIFIKRGCSLRKRRYMWRYHGFVLGWVGCTHSAGAYFNGAMHKSVGAYCRSADEYCCSVGAYHDWADAYCKCMSA